MSASRYDSRLIHKPERQQIAHRTLWGVVTLAFWGFYLYLWVPLLTLLSWLFGARLAWLQLYRQEQQVDTFVLVALPLICAACAIALIAWAEYNRFRFADKERRAPQAAATLDEVAQGLGVDVELARRLSRARIATLAMDDRARPVDVRIDASGAA
ncbi:poly-beta-1,6-N-acetyl-D-glucosamine biosynthesis protein PgaD [Luteimonas huabeiensis]|uniref:poly-beta-1,6-N-acetyl-D-glucosamine biosynthesis protein PgaD n=1 Tax=Luteimonas huabeiensis TaxID=1244513 RepID=UPI000466C275|nr:poly-beta-1,6-N-acetyl-D-glucosamine biosynthesis protein PgaD [Luteimonas huabeiensis]